MDTTNNKNTVRIFHWKNNDFIVICASISPLYRLQWGFAINSSSGAHLNISYPIEFSNNAFSGAVNYLDAAGTADIGICALNKTYMEVEIDASKSVTRDVRWFAIGY